MAPTKCCVPNCMKNAQPKHRFPNPSNNMERFEAWRNAIQSPTLFAMKPQNIFNSKKVCHAHFEDKYLTMGARIHVNAVPTLHLENNVETCFTLEEHVSFSEESSPSGQNMSDLENKQNYFKDVSELDVEQSGCSISTAKEFSQTTVAEESQDSSFQKVFLAYSKPLTNTKKRYVRVRKMQMEAENIADEVVSQKLEICTFCLNVRQLQIIKNPPMDEEEEFSRFSFIEAEIGYKLPERICEECLTTLNSCVSFVNMCKNSIAKIEEQNKLMDINEQYSTLEPVNGEMDEVQDLPNEFHEPAAQIADIDEDDVIASENEKPAINIAQAKTSELTTQDEWECPVQEDINAVQGEDINKVQLVVHEVHEKYINAIQEEDINSVQKGYIKEIQEEDIDEGQDLNVVKEKVIHEVQGEYINTIQGKDIDEEQENKTSVQQYIIGIVKQNINKEQEYVNPVQEVVLHEIQEEDINAVQEECVYEVQEVVNEVIVQSEKSENKLNTLSELVDHSYFTKKECPACHKTVSQLKVHYLTNRNCRPKKLSNFSDKDTYKSATTLNPRVLVLKDGKRFMCDQCGKSYTTASQLQDHQNLHSNIKPYRCPDCGKQFSVKSGLYLHRRVHDSNNASTENNISSKHTEHPLEEDKTVECPICHRYFIGHGLKMHMHTHNEDRIYKCRKCHKPFESISKYRQHLKTHAVKDAMCPYCQIMFSRATLKQHVKLHTEKCQFFCSDCEKWFRTRRHLTSHRSLIHNENRGKPWTCKYCNKSFNLKGNLRVHERLHTGEKPYDCHLCDEAFSDTKKRKRHIAQVHEEVQLIAEQMDFILSNDKT